MNKLVSQLTTSKRLRKDKKQKCKISFLSKIGDRCRGICSFKNIRRLIWKVICFIVWTFIRVILWFFRKEILGQLLDWFFGD